MDSLRAALCFLLLPLPFVLGAGIAEVIAQTPELSSLNTILTGQHPELLSQINSTTGTFFAPSNTALDSFIVCSADMSVAGGKVADTRLDDSAYANLEGAANVVFASSYGSTGQDSAPSALKVYSGVGGEATITKPDIAYDGGLVHIVDRVLNFPQSCSKTMQQQQLTTLFDAVQKTNYQSVIDTTAKFTCLAPTNEALAGLGIDLSTLSDDDILSALKYHSIVGEVDYSTVLEDGKEYPTLLGPTVTVHKKDGQLYFNDVAVQQGNIITNNGVAHVLSGVLIPPTSNATPTSEAAPPPDGTTTDIVPTPDDQVGSA
ncbi:hypothetical protein NMY22_g5847 [Coprinellus aureogranulatus]|nr:hypothetical protein NMY22_g5847 [Coprinellus aureogranulatus]